MAERYDDIGVGYMNHRAPDPRVAAQIAAALADARTVVNVGAGAGSYEPPERTVVAVEPSSVMIAQRASDAAPVVQAYAEELPFAGAAFDAALATFTVHHWQDAPRGLAELRRVAARQVVLTFDQADLFLDDFWLTRDYLPRDAFSGESLEGIALVLEHLDVQRIEVVPVPADCRDGFFAAYWKRPEAYLDADVRRSISALALLDDAVLASGLARLADDLASGAWADRNQDLLARDEMDFGYRLVVA